MNSNKPIGFRSNIGSDGFNIQYSQLHIHTYNNVNFTAIDASYYLFKFSMILLAIFRTNRAKGSKDDCCILIFANQAEFVFI